MIQHSSPLPVIYPNRCLYTQVHDSIIHSSPKVEAAMDEWMNRGCMGTMEYYSALKKNRILPSAMTRMEQESIMLSEVSQRKTHTMISLMRNLRNKANDHRGKEKGKPRNKTLREQHYHMGNGRGDGLNRCWVSRRALL